jgi:hypothetical protein
LDPAPTVIESHYLIGSDQPHPILIVDGDRSSKAGHGLSFIRLLHHQRAPQGNNRGNQQDQQHGGIPLQRVCAGRFARMNIEDLSQQGHIHRAAQERKQVDRADGSAGNRYGKQLLGGREPDHHDGGGTHGENEKHHVKQGQRQAGGEKIEYSHLNHENRSTTDKGLFAALEDAVGDKPQQGAADDHPPGDHTQYRAGRFAGKPVDMHQVRPAPQPAESEKNSAIEKKPQGQGPEMRVADHLTHSRQQGDGLHRCGRRAGFFGQVGNGRPPLVLGPVPDDQPYQQGDDESAPTDQFEGDPPAEGHRHHGQQPGGCHHAGPAHGVEDAGHGGELMGIIPLGEDLHGGDKDHGNAEPHQDAADEGGLDVGGQSEKDAADRCGHQKPGHRPPRPHGIREQACRQLHGRIAVEIDRTQQAHGAGGNIEIRDQVVGHDRQGKTMKVYKKISQGQDEKNEPAKPKQGVSGCIGHGNAP